MIKCYVTGNLLYDGRTYEVGMTAEFPLDVYDRMRVAGCLVTAEEQVAKTKPSATVLEAEAKARAELEAARAKAEQEATEAAELARMEAEEAAAARAETERLKAEADAQSLSERGHRRRR